MRSARAPLLALPILLVLPVLAAVLPPEPEPAAGPVPLDPAAWGSDHAGGPVPEYVTGDECLFCHRETIGRTWPENPHQRSVRPAETEPDALARLAADPAARPRAVEADYALGGARMVRFLRAGDGYGAFELLSTGYRPPGHDRPAALAGDGAPRWLPETFHRACAGCHASGVDPESRAVSDIGLDCFVCHGDATLAHAKDSRRMILAAARKDPPRVIASICGQCHVRTGTSRRTGLPFAANFVAGDNLFRDLAVDFSDEALGALNPADRHVLENVRDVAVRGRQEVTCLSCHDVHEPSTRRHQRLSEGSICLICHTAGRPKAEVKAFEVHSRTCRY